MVGWQLIPERGRGATARSFGHGILAEIRDGHDADNWWTSGAWWLRVSVNDEPVAELTGDDRDGLLRVANILGRDLARRAKAKAKGCAR